VKKPYHHGDLANALLDAAEVVLKRDGLAGVGMRSIAREAGVSHTAAKPHFGDIEGLLSELAAVGYRRLTAALHVARESQKQTRAKRTATAKAYIAFAQKNPQLFGLMFRTELVDMTRPTLRAAANTTLHALAGTTHDSGVALDEAAPPKVTRQQAIAMTAGWSLLHGLAVLAVDKRLKGILRTTDEVADMDELVTATIDSTTLTFS
jgi:AcrR family transcriptional regulator